MILPLEGIALNTNCQIIQTNQIPTHNILIDDPNFVEIKFGDYFQVTDAGT
jgi:hypothetical protein